MPPIVFADLSSVIKVKHDDRSLVMAVDSRLVKVSVAADAAILPKPEQAEITVRMKTLFLLVVLVIDCPHYAGYKSPGNL